MRVLFYHDPVYELGQPFFWKYFVRWTSQMRAGLDGVQCRFLLADHLVDHARQSGVPEDEMVPVREDRFRAFVEQRTGNWNSFWYERRYSDDSLRRAASFLGRALGSFVPDVILTHTPAPFLRTLFPSAVLLHFEAGLMKFPPFPMSFYFDPCGFFRDSWPVKHVETLRVLGLTREQQQEIDGLRAFFTEELLRPSSPFRPVMDEEGKRFRRKVLVPLQFNRFFGFDSQCPFASQFEFLRWVLDRTPSDIGVVVTQHVYFETLEPEAFAFLRSRHPNLIYHPVFSDYNTASQFLCADVDAIVTGSSSVGLQSLWWRLPLVAVGETHLSAIADGSDPAQLHQIIDAGWPSWKDALLHWYLTRYCPLESYVMSGPWLRSFLGRMHQDPDTFPLIDEEPQLFRRIRAEAIRDIGRATPSAARSFELLASERQRALEALREELEQRGALIDRLSSELEQRAALIDRLSSELEQRAAVIEELRIEAERRAVLIEELTLAVREREGRLAQFEALRERMRS
jgi:Membrane-bound metallopeptidase